MPTVADALKTLEGSEDDAFEKLQAMKDWEFQFALRVVNRVFLTTYDLSKALQSRSPELFTANSLIVTVIDTLEALIPDHEKFACLFGETEG